MYDVQEKVLVSILAKFLKVFMSRATMRVRVPSESLQK